MFKTSTISTSLAAIFVALASAAYAGATVKNYCYRSSVEPVVSVEGNKISVTTGGHTSSFQSSDDALVTLNGRVLKAPRSEAPADDENLVDATITFSYKTYVEVEPGYSIWYKVLDNDGNILTYGEIDDNNIPDTETTVRTLQTLFPKDGGYVVIFPQAYRGNGGGNAVYINRIEPGQTEISVDASEAVYHFAPRMKDEEGNEVEFARGHYALVDDDVTFIQTATSDVSVAQGVFDIQFKGLSQQTYLVYFDFVNDLDNPDNNQYWDLWSNYISDDLGITMVLDIQYKGNKGMLNGIGSIRINEPVKMVYNDPSTYYSMDPEIVDSPWADINENFIRQCRIRMYRSVEYLMFESYWTGNFPYEIFRVSYFPEEVSTSIVGSLAGRVQYADPNYFQFIATLTPFFTRDYGYIAPTAVDAFAGEAGLGFPRNKWVSEPMSMSAPAFGAGPSFLTFGLGTYEYWEDPSINIPYFYLGSTGFRGDYRMFDSSVVDFDISSGDETICKRKDFNYAVNILSDYCIANPGMDNLNVVVTNRNQTLGDRTVTTVCATDINWTANPAVPALTALNIHDRDGFFAYDLASTDDATLVVGGLSRYSADTDVSYAPVTLVAEYSPAGVDDWKAFELTVENEFEPGIGTLALAPLSAVADIVPEGLFDLRVTVTNDDGGSSVTTVSPAFRVAALSGVGLVGADSKNNAVYYNLQGQRLDKPVKGVNIVRYSDGTSAKVVF